MRDTIYKNMIKPLLTITYIIDSGRRKQKPSDNSGFLRAFLK